MRDLKSLFSNVFKTKNSFPGTHEFSKQPLSRPEAFDSPSTIFRYLNFAIPELQPIKLSLDFGKEQKAFEQFFQYLKMRPSPSFLYNRRKRDELVQTLDTHHADSVEDMLTAADRILRHQFLLFSTHWIHAEQPILWNILYEPGAESVDEYWPSGKRYRSAKLLADAQRDIHFVWEFNRHQHFLDLGKAYWYTDDERYAQEFVDEISGWIDQNPYSLSVNWTDQYEIAIRGLFWLLGYAFFLKSEFFTEQFFCRFYQALLSHGHAIYETLQTASTGLSPRDSVAQASFLYLLGTSFPEYLHSKIWAKTGWDILQWKTPLLTEEMLLHVPLASFVSCIELYSLVLLSRTRHRYHLPHAVLTGVTAMLERLSLFLQPDGRLGGFGEESPRRLLAGMCSQHDTTFHALFSMAALLLHNATLATLGKTLDSSLVWFFGEEGHQTFREFAPTSHDAPSVLIPNTSYAVMRNGWDETSSYCLVSTGRPCAPPSVPLQHSDLLSFELVANGHRYITDSGPYSFHPTEAWNQYFCSTQAHNSITVDRVSHINVHDPSFESVFDQWLSTPTFDFLSGYHTGFEDLDQPITHRRSIFYYKPAYWIVCDLLTGEGQHFFDQYFHFPSFHLNVDFTNKSVNIHTSPQHRFVLAPLNPDEMDVTIITGGETPDSGWISQGYKQAVEAPFIKYGKQTSAPVSFHTLFHAYHSEQLLQFSSRSLQAFFEDQRLLTHEVSALEITQGDETHRFVLRYTQKYPRIQVDGMTFEGTLFFLKTHGTTVSDILLYNATLLTLEDQVLFASDVPVQHLALQLEQQTLHVICEGNTTFRTQLSDITEVFVNHRQVSLQRQENMLVIATSRI